MRWGLILLAVGSSVELRRDGRRTSHKYPVETMVGSVAFFDYHGDNDIRPGIGVAAPASERYALFRNEEGLFNCASDSTGPSRGAQRSSGQGLKFVDFDNDGWKDLLVGQRHIRNDIEQEPRDCGGERP